MRTIIFLLLVSVTCTLSAQSPWRFCPEVGIGKRKAVALPHRLFGSTSNVTDASGSGSRFTTVGVHARYALHDLELEAGVAFVRIGYDLEFTRRATYQSLHGPYNYEGEERLSGNIHALSIPVGVSYTRALKKTILLGAFAEGAWLYGFSHSALHGGYEYNVEDDLFFISVAAGPVIGCKLDENGTSAELRPSFNYLLWQQREVFSADAFAVSFSVLFPFGKSGATE